MIDLPSVSFQDNSGSNWRESLADEVDPDDDELDETPEDVIMMLGFDPKEFNDPEPVGDAEFEESKHPRAPNGQFGQGSGGGSSSGGGGGNLAASINATVAKSDPEGTAAAAKYANAPAEGHINSTSTSTAAPPAAPSKPTYTMPSGPKIHALPMLAKQMQEKLGKMPSEQEFLQTLDDLHVQMNSAQAIKYLKLHMKAQKESAMIQKIMKAEGYEQPKSTAAVGKPTEIKPTTGAAVPKVETKVAPASQTSTAEFIKASGHASAKAFLDDVAPKQGYAKEGTFNGIEYYKADDGTKISYKPDTDTWQAQDKNKTKLTEGTGLTSLAIHLGTNKKEASTTPAPQSVHTMVKTTSTASAPAYGTKLPAEKFSYASSGIANELGLPPKVQSSISAYKGNTYDAINDALRFNKEFDTNSPTIMSHILNLQLAFAQIPPSKKDAMVGRKIGVDALKAMAKDAGLDDLNDIKEGVVMHEMGVASTSHSPHVWHGNVRLEINVPKGSKAIDISETIKKNQGEKEVLLPPGSKFKVNKVEKDAMAHGSKYAYVLHVDYVE